MICHTQPPEAVRPRKGRLMRLPCNKCPAAMPIWTGPRAIGGAGHWSGASAFKGPYSSPGLATEVLRHSEERLTLGLGDKAR
jgi:hypothetical protein